MAKTKEPKAAKIEAKPNAGKFTEKPEGERRTRESKVYVTPAFHAQLTEFVERSKRLKGEPFRSRDVADYYRLAVESQLQADLEKEAKRNARKAAK